VLPSYLKDVLSIHLNDFVGKAIAMRGMTRKRGSEFGLLVVLCLWCGLLFGVSFVATPAKFMAPSLNLPVALDVGRYTFAIFNKVEWVCAVLVAAFLIVGVRKRLVVLMVATILTVLLLETICLLPALDHRVGLIMAGQQPPPSHLHVIYIVLECLKLATLAASAFVTMRHLVRTEPFQNESESVSRGDVSRHTGSGNVFAD
jgi:hypothetical protein